MSSSNVKSPIESIIGGKNKADDNDNDTFDNNNNKNTNNDTRSHKKSKAVLKIDDNDFNRKEDYLRDKINEKRKELGPSHYETIETMNSLVKHYLTGGINIYAKFILVEIENILKSTPERKPIETIKLLMLMAKSYSTNALDDSKSKGILLDCYARWCALPPEDNYDTSDVMDQLAAHYVRENNYVKAVQLLNESYEVKRRCRGYAYHDTLITMYELAKVYLQLQIDNIDGEQNFNKAVSLLRRCLRTRQANDANVVYHLLSKKIMNTLAEAYTSCGKQEEANLVRSNFEMKKQKLLNGLTNTKELQAIDDEEIERELEVICLETESSLGANHFETLELMSQLADAYIAHKKYDKAEIVLKRLLERHLSVNGDTSNHDTIITISTLIIILTRMKKYLEASQQQLHLKSILLQLQGNEGDDLYELLLIKTIQNLARNYDEQGKHQQAIDEFKELILLRKKCKSSRVRSIDNIDTLNEICLQYYKLLDYCRLLSAMKDHLLLTEEYHGKYGIDTLIARNRLAKAYSVRCHWRVVEKLFDDAEVFDDTEVFDNLELFRTEEEDKKVLMEVLKSMDILSSAYEKHEKMREATYMLEASVGRRMKVMGQNDFETNKVRIRLGRMYLKMGDGQKALHHLCIAKVVQDNERRITVGCPEINDLIATAEEMGKTIK